MNKYDFKSSPTTNKLIKKYKPGQRVHVSYKNPVYKENYVDCDGTVVSHIDLVEVKLDDGRTETFNEMWVHKKRKWWLWK